ncbi:glycosyltransferase 87 family protein [Actinokineospora pegani]|uniref:glycosyltransferase 87 family protein n=1 Tax=Actinokineospora pegani TaxID=2654637 RepID=UPI0012EAD94A|nr:glycosyltransferase 87 family protein [Actinokineospora pegani]
MDSATAQRQTPAPRLRGLSERPSYSVLFFVLCGLASAGALAWIFRIEDQLIDLQVYRFGVEAWWSGGDPYALLPPTSVGVALWYLYPPSSLLAFAPLTVVPWELSVVLATGMSVLAVVVSLAVVISRVWPAGGRMGAFGLAAGLLPFALLLEPVAETIKFGQVNLWLMALVVVDCLVRTPKWPRGLLVGIAIAVKLTPAVFLLYFLLRRDFRAAVVTCLSAAACTALAFVLAWQESLDFWFTGAGPTDRMAGSAIVTNQTVAGALARFGIDAPYDKMVWLGAAMLVGLIFLWVVPRVDAETGVAVTAMAALVLSPISWSHHYVWIVPGLVVVAARVLRTPWNPAKLMAAAFGLAIFYVAPHFIARSEESDGTKWTWWQNIYGNSYLLLGLAALIWVAWAHRPSATLDRELADVADPRPRVKETA